MDVWHLSTICVVFVQKTLITGADSGIGRAVALAFAREGADVAIAYLNEHKDAEVPFQPPANTIAHASLHVSCAYATSIAAHWAISILMLPVCIMLHKFIGTDLCTTVLPVFIPVIPVARIDLLLLLYS